MRANVNRTGKKILLLSVLLFLLPLSAMHADEDSKISEDKSQKVVHVPTKIVHGLGANKPLLPMNADNNVIPFATLDLYGTYSDANTGGDVWGAIVAGDISPVIKLGDELYCIPLYDGSYERQKFFAHVEEGGRIYNEKMHHDLTLSAKYLPTRKTIISPYLFGGWDFNVETDDEEWGDGLYDYHEFGSGIDFDYIVYDLQDERIILNSGFKWYLRHYPNFQTLISLASITAPEEDEKDFHALEFETGWNYTRRKNLSLGLKYSLFLKFFTDKKVIDADGVLKNNKRSDVRNTLRLETYYAANPDKGLQANCIIEFAYNTSNQNFYDSRNTVTLTDDVYTPSYFDYLSLQIQPQLSYIFRKKDKTIAILTCGYDMTMRDYRKRLAQNAAGIYSTDEQRDYQHIFETTISIPIDEHINWVTGYDYTINKSNMDFERYYEYNYTMHRVLTGIAINY